MTQWLRENWIAFLVGAAIAMFLTTDVWQWLVAATGLFEWDRRSSRSTPDRDPVDEVGTTDEIDQTVQEHTDDMESPQGETPGAMLREQAEDLP